MLRLTGGAERPAAARPQIDPGKMPVSPAPRVLRLPLQKRQPRRRRRPRRAVSEAQPRVEPLGEIRRVLVVDRAVPGQHVGDLRRQPPREGRRQLDPFP